jgi:hypothetical protein
METWYAALSMIKVTGLSPWARELDFRLEILELGMLLAPCL